MGKGMNVSLALSILFVVLVIEFIVVSALSAAPGKVVDAAALLTVITGAAVAIERLLEGMWSTVALFGGSDWWPLNVLSKEVQGFADALDAQLQQFFAQARAEVAKLAQANTQVGTDVDAAKKEIDDLEAKLNALLTSSPSSARVQAVIDSTNQMITALQKKYPDLQAASALVSVALANFSSAADYLKDNPGRKVISLYLGMLLGMLAAALLHLDLVQATLGPAAANYVLGPFKLTYVSVALTGLAVGLGSNPLHEVIGTLQQLKKNLAS